MLLNLIKVYTCLEGVTSENLARNKHAFLSSTEGFKVAELAVDTNVDLNTCSLTTKSVGLKSWFFVDLRNVYEITKVCLLNSATGKKKLLIFIKKKLTRLLLTIF